MPQAFRRSITDEQFNIIRDRMMPHLTRRGKQRPKQVVLDFLVNMWPARIEYELLRLDGRAFDADEAGFSYSKGDGDVQQC